MEDYDQQLELFTVPPASLPSSPELTQQSVIDREKWHWLNTIKQCYTRTETAETTLATGETPAQTAMMTRRIAWSHKYRAHHLYAEFSGNMTDEAIADSQFNADLERYTASNRDSSEWLEQYAAAHDLTVPRIIIPLLEYTQQRAAQDNLEARRFTVARVLGTLKVLKYLEVEDITDISAGKVMPMPGSGERYIPAEVIAEKAGNVPFKDYHPELSRLSGQERELVTKTIIDEVVVCLLTLQEQGITDYSPGLLLRPISSYLPVLRDFPDVAPQLAARLLKNPALDYYSLREAAKKFQLLKTQTAANPRPAPSKFDQEYERLRSNTQLNHAICDLSLGETIVVQGDGDSNMVKKAIVGNLVEQHLKLAGYNLRRKDETRPLAEDGALWAHWNRNKVVAIADKLIGKFNGNVMNLRFTALPVDADYFAEFVNDPSSWIEIDGAIRYAVSIDLKSSGKSPITNMIDTVLYMRDSADRGKSVVLSVRGRSKNEDPIEFLHLESVKNGVALEIQALRHTFSAGAGSLGKRR